MLLDVVPIAARQQFPTPTMEKVEHKHRRGSQRPGVMRPGSSGGHKAVWLCGASSPRLELGSGPKVALQNRLPVLDMRFLYRLLLGILVGQFAVVSAAARVTDPPAGDWRTYVGPRYGTTVEFPAGMFAPAGDPQKGVGQRFKSMDGRASFSVYALRDEVGDGPAGYLERNLRVRKSAIQYKRIAHSFFAISMERDGLIYYSRCNFVSRVEPIIHCFDLDYPQDEKRAWDPIVTRVSLSLRPLER